MWLVACLEVFGRVLASLCIFTGVNSPADAWRVLALQASCTSLSTGLGLLLMYHEIEFRLPSWTATVESLRSGFNMFFFRGAVSLYTTANVLILGLFSSPALVGYYAGAEKVVRGFAGLIGPLSQAVYPRMSFLIHHDYSKALQLARLTLWVMVGFSSFLAVGLWLAAKPLIQLFLGSGYEPSVPLLRLLAFILPLIAVGNVLGIQWMLPLGMDRLFNGVIAGAGFLNVGLAFILTPRFGPTGMAVAVVVAELFVATTVSWILWKRGQGPLGSDAA